MAAKIPRKPLPARQAGAGRSHSPAGRNVGLVVLALLAAVSGWLGFTLRSNPSLIRYIPALIQPKSVTDVFPNQKSVNITLIGRDYDYNDQDQIIKTNARSDMLMVAHLDFANNSLSLLSIPRDTRAVIKGHGVHKINAAHAEGGPALTEATVLSNFGIPSDKYLAVDFVGFEKAIDLLGGVDLNVDKQMDYDDNWGHLHIHLKPGLQHLNGQEAMEFVRFRHSDSDLVRVQRQQALLAVLKAKLHDPTALAHIPAILEAIDNHTNSDLSDEQKVALARFVHDLPHDQISMTTLPSLVTRSTYVHTDWDKASTVIHNIFGVSPPMRTADAADPGHRSRRHHNRHHIRVAAQS